MVTLHAHDFEVGQPIQAHRLQLVEGYDTIPVLVETLQYRLDDELGLSGMLDFILPGTPGLSTRAMHGNTLTTHLGLLLRVHVVDAIHRLNFFLVPTAIAGADVGRCGGESNVMG